MRIQCTTYRNMEKLELKKSIEKTKATIIFLMVLLILSIPSFLIKFSDKTDIVMLALISTVIFLLYKRVCRLNFKLTSLIK